MKFLCLIVLYDVRWWYVEVQKFSHSYQELFCLEGKLNFLEKSRITLLVLLGGSTVDIYYNVIGC